MFVCLRVLDVLGNVRSPGFVRACGTMPDPCFVLERCRGLAKVRDEVSRLLARSRGNQSGRFSR